MILQKDYKTYLAVELSNISEGEIQIDLGDVVDSDMGFILIEPGNINQESIFFHRRTGASVFCYGINRSNPITHLENSQVLVVNSIDYMNYLLDQTNRQLYIYKKSLQHLVCVGGVFYDNGKNITLSNLDTELALENKTLTSNATNYLYIYEEDFYITTTPITEEAYLIATIVTGVGGNINVLTRHNTFVVGNKGEKGDSASIGLGTVSTGAAGSEVEITNSGTEQNAIFNFVIPEGDKGDEGEPGEELQIRVNSGYIQTKYTDESIRTNLISLTSLTGASGKSVEIQKTSTYIQWRLIGDTTWINLVELSTLKGDDAPQLQIQYSINGSTLWHTTFATGDLYQRVSSDGGSTWSGAIKFVGINGTNGTAITGVTSNKVGKVTTITITGTFVGSPYQYTINDGEDGDDAPQLQIQYSIDGATLWHTTFVEGDKYQRASVNGGSTWSSAMRFIGEDGEGSGDMLGANNLSELTDLEIARENLGLEIGVDVLAQRTFGDIVDSDIADFAPALGADDNYVTDLEKTKLSNLSNTNSGDEDTTSILTKIGNGSLISSSYLPGYVDDVIEVATYSALPVTGETGKIYIVLTGVEANREYRWSGTAYVEIKDSGESEASMGALFNIASGKATPVDADKFGIWDSITGFLQTVTWADIKTMLGSLFQTKETTTSEYQRNVICRARTTANIASLSGTMTVDGVVLVAGNYILVANQSTASQNGVYQVNAGAWTRVPEYDETIELDKHDIFIVEGTTYKKTWWVCATKNATVGTTSLSFAQIPNGIGTAADQSAAGNHSHTALNFTGLASFGASIAKRYTSRTATASTGSTDNIVRFSGSTAAQIETMPDGVAVANNSGRVISFINNATVNWTLRQFTSNTLDGSASDFILRPGYFKVVMNTAVDTWITIGYGRINDTIDLEVATEAYGAGWNGSNEVPTKDAIYDKIETLGGGSVSSTQSTFVAGEDITAGDALYLYTVDGKVYKTDAYTISKIKFIGFATNTVSSGGNVIVDTEGISNTQTGLTIGSSYYLKNYYYSDIVNSSTIQQLTGGNNSSDIFVGADGSSSIRPLKQRQQIQVVGDIIVRSVTIGLRRTNTFTRTDGVGMNIYSSDGTTLLKLSTTTIPYTSITTTEQYFTFQFEDIDVSGSFFIEVFATGGGIGGDNNNYMITASTTSLYGYSARQCYYSSTWNTISTSDMYFNIQMGSGTITRGKISTTHGTNISPVGTAISSTGIEIYKKIPLTNNDVITFTRDMNAVTGTVNYSHSLGVVPTYIKITGYNFASSVSISSGVHTGSSNKAIYANGNFPQAGSTNTECFRLYSSSSSYQSGIVSAKSTTEITFSYTKSGTGSGIGYFIVELFA